MVLGSWVCPCVLAAYFISQPTPRQRSSSVSIIHACAQIMQNRIHDRRQLFRGTADSTLILLHNGKSDSRRHMSADELPVAVFGVGVGQVARHISFALAELCIMRAVLSACQTRESQQWYVLVCLDVCVHPCCAHGIFIYSPPDTHYRSGTLSRTLGVGARDTPPSLPPISSISFEVDLLSHNSRTDSSSSS